MQTVNFSLIRLLSRANRSYKNFIKTALYLSICFIVLCAFSLAEVHAAGLTCTWNAGVGNWSTGGNWDCAAAPGAGDIAIIDTGYTVTLTGTTTVGKLTVTGASAVLDLGGYDLNVTYVDSTYDGSVTVGTSGIIDASTTTPTITVGGHWDSSNGTFTYGTSTVVMTGSTKTMTATANSDDFYNLTINSLASVTDNSGLIIQAGGLLTVSGTLTIASGKEFWIINTANMTINSTGTLTIIGALYRYIDNNSLHFTNDGTINGSGVFNYTAKGLQTAQRLTATNYGDLDITLSTYAPAGGNATLILGPSGATLTTTGDLLIFQQNGDGGPITISNTTIAVNVDNLTLGSTSATEQGTLVAGSATYNITGNVLINDTTVASEIDVDADTATFNVGGNWTNSDTFTAGSSRVDFTGTGAQSITSGGSSFYNLDISNTSNTVSLSDALVLLTNGTLTIDANATLYLGGNNLTVPTTFVNNGTLQLQGGETTVSLTMDIDSGTVEYIGDGDSTSDTDTIKQLGGTYFNLTINDPNGTPANRDIFQLGAGLGVVGDLTVTSGTLNYNSKTLTLSGANKNYTIGTDGLVNGSGGTTNITGTITYTDSSTSGTQNIGDLNVN